MAVRIRLTRIGAHKQPTYRVVVADGAQRPRRSSLETIGHYNPRTEPIEFVVDAEQGEGVARQGRPAVGHRPAALPQAGILPAGK